MHCISNTNETRFDSNGKLVSFAISGTLVNQTVDQNSRNDLPNGLDALRKKKEKTIWARDRADQIQKIRLSNSGIQGDGNSISNRYSYNNYYASSPSESRNDVGTLIGASGVGIGALALGLAANRGGKRYLPNDVKQSVISDPSLKIDPTPVKPNKPKTPKVPNPVPTSTPASPIRRVATRINEPRTTIRIEQLANEASDVGTMFPRFLRKRP